MIAVQAELTQTPFDMPIAESELVAGYMTEYSGFRFLIFFIAEFATAGVFAADRRRAVPRRLGRAVRLVRLDDVDDGRQLDERRRPADPVHQDDGARRSSSSGSASRYPRFREDQLQRFAWKVLIPLSLVNIMVTAILKVAF